MDADYITPCGAVHPNYPHLKCIRFGKCWLDDHLAILDHRDIYGIIRWRELVRFGKTAEAMARDVYGSGYRIIKIIEGAKD